ncbi:polycystic kidney disease protein 1-like 2 [Rhincodon typus]|uniref:polycystic kidney disease protein 1-like 2 n=1 Tax=Rhincodon typus TaxID=259920 RepID=UPI00202F41F2|nr:polycystic kidney disease protein 1-like 2 [Rhincodon typus]
MLSNLSVVDVSSLHEAVQVSEVLKQLTYKADELTSTSQLEASSTLLNMGKSLLTFSVVDDEDPEKRIIAANTLFNVVNNVLEAAVENDGQEHLAMDTQRVISEKLLDTIDHLQAVVLNDAIANEEPVLMMMPSVSMYLQRLPADNTEGNSIILSDSTVTSFTLPAFQSLNIQDDMDTVDMRVDTAEQLQDTVKQTRQRNYTTYTHTKNKKLEKLAITTNSNQVSPVSRLKTIEVDIEGVFLLHSLSDRYLIRISSARPPIVYNIILTCSIPGFAARLDAMIP